MNELSLIVFAAIFAVGAVVHLSASRSWTKERAQLLDRIMARSYSEYVYATKPDGTTDTPQLTTDQAEEAWYAAQERARLTEVA